MSTAFTVINAATGEIQSQGFADDLDILGGDGLIVMAEQPSTGAEYYEAGEWKTKPVRPNPFMTWDWAAKTWGDPRSLNELRLSRWAAIKSAREAAEFGGFTWDGSTFDSDRESQSRIQGAAQLATLAMLSSQQFSVDWTLADNTVRTLSGADMLAVGQQMGVHIMTTHATGRALRDATEAATTSEELGTITWPA